MTHPPRIGVTGLIVLLIGSCISFCLAQPAQLKRGSIDWILVLDTSASMHGAEGAANIFDRVKTTLADFIRATHQGDSVALYTFDSDTQLHSNIRIMTETDKLELLKAIYALQSSGLRTYTGKALHDALVRAKELKDRPDASDRTVSIVLFTDGLEDVRGIPNPISIPSNISLIPKDQPYVFFVSLGKEEHEKQLEDFVKAPEMGQRGEVVRAPGAARIEEVAESIRKTIEQPSAPKPVNLSAEPENLDFGTIEPGTSTSQKLNIRSDGNITVKLQLESGGDLNLVEPTAPFDLKTGQNTFNVTLGSGARVPDGVYNIRLNLSPTANSSDVTARPLLINARVGIAHIRLWRRAVKWLGLLLLAILLVLIALSVIKGEPPWIWMKQLIRHDNNLEGEIEVIQPRPARPEDEYISLTHRQTDRVTLSTLVPDATASGSDAELVTTRRNGQKSIQLRRTQGVICVNKIEVAMLDIYDGDLIEFGDARLRFNWMGHERPVEAEPEA